jgi:hypothetical protein
LALSLVSEKFRKTFASFQHANFLVILALELESICSSEILASDFEDLDELLELLLLELDEEADMRSSCSFSGSSTCSCF